MNDKRSLQDIHAPKSICFGCGPLNENGLKIKSYKYKNGLRMSFHPKKEHQAFPGILNGCLLYTSPSPRDLSTSRMPSSA